MRASRRRRRNRIAIIGVLVLASTTSIVADDLKNWIAKQIREDEALLADALNETNGRSIDLLKSSPSYVPFFLDQPNNNGEGAESIGHHLDRDPTKFVSGGYVFRLRFEEAQPLYALSGGDWAAEKWYSPRFNSELGINGLEVWAGDSGSEFSYASYIRGMPPRIVVYDLKGKSVEKTFHPSDEDFSASLEVELALYSNQQKPTLELVTLAEFLKNEDLNWRPAAINSNYNFRNQHFRPEEAEYIIDANELNRNEAINILSNKVADASELPSDGNTSHIIDQDRKATSMQTHSIAQTNGKSPVLIIVGGVVLLSGAIVLIRFCSRSA